MSTKRVVIIASSVVGALLVAAIVVGVILLNTMNSQAEQQTYRDCMARHGFAADEPAGSITTDDEVDEYIDGLAAAAEACSSD